MVVRIISKGVITVGYIEKYGADRLRKNAMNTLSIEGWSKRSTDNRSQPGGILHFRVDEKCHRAMERAEQVLAPWSFTCTSVVRNAVLIEYVARGAGIAVTVVSAFIKTRTVGTLFYIVHIGTAAPSIGTPTRLALRI